MPEHRMDCSHILLIQANAFMEPALKQTFEELGAVFFSDKRLLDLDTVLTSQLV